MTDSIYTGLELEFHLIDSEGNVVNEAPTVLQSPLASDSIKRESAQSMVEVVAKPGRNLQETYDRFRQSLSQLHKITDDMGLLLLPSTTVGSDATPISNDSLRTRGQAKRAILGDGKRNLEHHICGTHLHVDKLPDQTYEQFITFQAMDPAFALMAASPFFLGQNTQKDYRVSVYRNLVFENFSLQGQLNDYPISEQDLLGTQQRSYEDWMRIAREMGIDDVESTPLNTVWGPIRLSEKTVETRIADANLYSNIRAFTALFTGVANYLQRESPTVRIDWKEEASPQEYFVPHNNIIVLPPHSYLKDLESRGIQYALADDKVAGYLRNVMSVSYQGLENESHLSRFEEMLETRRAFADDIIDFAVQGGLEKDGMLTCPDAARSVRLYIANRYREDFE